MITMAFNSRLLEAIAESKNCRLEEVAIAVDLDCDSDEELLEELFDLLG